MGFEVTFKIKMRPKESMPELKLSLINGAIFNLAEQNAKNFTILYFYRGLHCPICKKQLESITRHLSDFEERGVNVCAISMDDKDRALKTEEEWDVESLPIAYGLDEDKARELGLYISKAISDKEPDHFSEPGIFLVNSDNNLYFSSIQTMPFARPSVENVLSAIDFIKKEDYPARGAY
ncbi:MAG: peroxiredoxin-like family protein [Nonlabens sp.]